MAGERDAWIVKLVQTCERVLSDLEALDDPALLLLIEDVRALRDRLNAQRTTD